MNICIAKSAHQSNYVQSFSRIKQTKKDWMNHRHFYENEYLSTISGRRRQHIRKNKAPRMHLTSYLLDTSHFPNISVKPNSTRSMWNLLHRFETLTLQDEIKISRPKHRSPFGKIPPFESRIEHKIWGNGSSNVKLKKREWPTFFFSSEQKQLLPFRLQIIRSLVPNALSWAAERRLRGDQRSHHRIFRILPPVATPAPASS